MSEQMKNFIEPSQRNGISEQSIMEDPNVEDKTGEKIDLKEITDKKIAIFKEIENYPKQEQIRAGIDRLIVVAYIEQKRDLAELVYFFDKLLSFIDRGKAGTLYPKDNEIIGGEYKGIGGSGLLGPKTFKHEHLNNRVLVEPRDVVDYSEINYQDELANIVRIFCGYSNNKEESKERKGNIELFDEDMTFQSFQTKIDEIFMYLFVGGRIGTDCRGPRNIDEYLSYLNTERSQWINEEKPIKRVEKYEFEHSSFVLHDTFIENLDTLLLDGIFPSISNNSDAPPSNWKIIERLMFGSELSSFVASGMWYRHIGFWCGYMRPATSHYGNITLMVDKTAEIIIPPDNRRRDISYDTERYNDEFHILGRTSPRSIIGIVLHGQSLGYYKTNYLHLSDKNIQTHLMLKNFLDVNIDTDLSYYDYLVLLSNFFKLPIYTEQLRDILHCPVP